jgi:hypothetical protein
LNTEELQNRERKYRAQWRAYSIIKRMRWITLILGPFAILWDHVIAPLFKKFGLPDVVTMEDVAQAIVFRTGLITEETFETYWPHLNNVCTALFLVFIFWTIQKRKAAKDAAQNVVELERRMMMGGFGNGP